MREVRLTRTSSLATHCLIQIQSALVRNRSGRNDTLHATYTLLESLGVHWLGPYSGGNFVPRRDTVVAPVGGVPLTQAPVLLKRQIRKVYKTAEYYTPNVPWLNQSVFDALAAKETLWLQRMRLGQHNTPPWGQAFSTWWKRCFSLSLPPSLSLSLSLSRSLVLSLSLSLSLSDCVCV